MPRRIHCSELSSYDEIRSASVGEFYLHLDKDLFPVEDQGWDKDDEHVYDCIEHGGKFCCEAHRSHSTHKPFVER